MQWFRPVVGCFFFLLLVCCVVHSVGATPYTAADCNCGGIGLPLDGSWPISVPENGYYALTCQYGGYADIPYKGKGNGVEFILHKESAQAALGEYADRQKVILPVFDGVKNDKRRHLIEYVPPGPAYISLLSTQPSTSGTSTIYNGQRAIIYKNSYYIFVSGFGYDVGEEQFKATMDAAESCAKAVADGGVPPSKQVIKGTIRGSRLTKEIYTDLNQAINDEYSGRSLDKRFALEERVNAGGYAKNPIRHVKVIWKGSTDAGVQDPEYTTSTDENGKFEIPAVLEPGKQYEFVIEFMYRKGSTEYFSISDAGVYNVAQYSHVFEYTGERDLQQDIDILAELDKADVDKEYVVGVTSTLMLYDETANAFEFYTEHLGEKLDCNLPLSVYPFWPDRRSKFEIDSGRGNGTPAPAIIITPADSSPDNLFRFQYVVYHELSHYAMYCIYGKRFPESPADKSGPIKTINHGGYMNPSTSDSFTEGFAEFMPAVMTEYYGNSMIAGTMSGVSIGDEYKAWDDAGKAESHAVSSTLWSMYDTDAHYEFGRSFREMELRKTLADPALVEYEANLKGITVDEYRAQVTREIGLLKSGKNTFLSENPVRLRFDEIWPVLRTYQQDVAAVHDSLVSRYPTKKAAIDTVFVNHGFYQDTNRGNGSYDPREPFRPASGDRKTYAAGDPFIDCPRAFRYTGTETVGPAGDYLRTTRRSTEPLPGHFIKTPVDVPLYVVNVEYEDRPWKSYRTLVSSEKNMVPVPIPPQGENAGVTVIPVGVKSANPLYFRSEEFNRNFPAAAARGYYLEHDFKVSGPIPVRTTVKAWGGSTRGLSGTGSRSGIFTSTGPALRALEGAGAGNIRSLWILLVPVGIIAVFLFLKKNRK